MTLVGTAAAPVGELAASVGATGAVAVVGGRSRWELGGPPAGGTRLVRAPAGVLEHRPEEMTVRVLAGTTVADLDHALAGRGQRSALPDRGGTVGGAVAVGENHLDVPMRGPVRSSVLQVRYVAHDGRVVSGGAPTVKNVTGFDLPRLMVGALGTLGLLAEVVLRTNPVPAGSVWVAGDEADPWEVADRLLRRSTVLWDGRRTWVHLEGHRADVDARRRSLPGRWDEVAGPPGLPVHRWSMRPSELRALGGGSGSGGGPAVAGPFVASVGVGTVFAGSPQAARAVDSGARILALRAKELFDPSGRLNPGRDPARR